MTQSSKIILGVAAVAAVAGVGYYLYKKKTGTATTTSPTGATVPKTGGGTGANASSSPAFNGSLQNLFSGISGIAGYFNGSSASTGHLPNGAGGATAVPSPSDSGNDAGIESDGSGEVYDYSLYE